MPVDRAMAVRNAHPRLRIPLGAVAKVIALLDERFEMLGADLPFLSLPRLRRQELKSKIELPSRATSHPKSRIRGIGPAGELSIVFLTDPALAKIHADFMNDPKATDVITFEGDPTVGLAGEICVSADTAARYVGLPLVGAPVRGRRQAPALQNTFANELTLYVVHGWLHLAGYDDLQPAKKRRMRAAEKRAMALLKKAEAVPAFRLI